MRCVFGQLKRLVSNVKIEVADSATLNETTVVVLDDVVHMNAY